jgi:hypothetical protein
MAVQVAHDDVIGDVAGGGREVASLPEPLAPVAFADVLELLLDFASRAPFCPADEVGDRDMRRNLDEHVHVMWTCSGIAPVTYLTMPPWLRMRAG